MIDQLTLKRFYSIVAVFIAAGCLYLTKELYWFASIPIVLGVLLLAIYAIDVLLFIIVFCTPLAINFAGSGLALSIPTEPLLAGVMIIFLVKIAFEGGFDRKILYHPVSVVIMLNLAWMFLTSITSTMVVVSLKHFIAQLWFICPFYFLGTQLFKDFKNIRRFVWLYLIPLFIVIAYTIINQQLHGFTEKSAHSAMYPFYNDHTAYAAVIALFLPVTIAFVFEKQRSSISRILAFIATVILIIALVMSYTRAAWISLAFALLVYTIFALRIKFYIVLIGMIAGLTLYFTYQTQITMKLEKNRQQSATEFNKHLKSISNITTDNSNRERLNRWNCAIRMYEAKPVFGWGPGTYQFNYAPFQFAKEKTAISTNRGDRGNAHSEYLGPLAESGLLGLLFKVLIVSTIIYRATILYSKSKDKQIRLFTLSILLGLITYFVHGILNNFLDTDKASVPFWGFVAMIVAMDVYHSKGSKESNPKEII
jgi:putative inorganic carbon (hco3(-)) transporter